jgi:hypothetical protein
VKLYVYSISTFVALSLSGSFSTALALTPTRISAAPSSATAARTNQYKSFHEWKNSMISSAEARAKVSQDAVSSKRGSASTDPNLINKTNSEAGISTRLEELHNQAEKDSYQVSMAKDLTISDYFVGYLTKQKDLTGAINEVAGRLSTDEVAELMSAYSTNFFSSQRINSALTGPARSGTNQ